MSPSSQCLTLRVGLGTLKLAGGVRESGLGNSLLTGDRRDCGLGFWNSALPNWARTSQAGAPRRSGQRAHPRLWGQSGVPPILADRSLLGHPSLTSSCPSQPSCCIPRGFPSPFPFTLFWEWLLYLCQSAFSSGPHSRLLPVRTRSPRQSESTPACGGPASLLTDTGEMHCGPQPCTRASRRGCRDAGGPGSWGKKRRENWEGQLSSLGK